MSGTNAARPLPGARLIRLDDVPDPGALALDFRVGEQLFSLIVARRGALVRGYENSCPHAGLPLERPDGQVVLAQARYLVCSAHGASFTLETGACAGGPASRALTPAPVLVEDGWVVAAA